MDRFGISAFAEYLQILAWNDCMKNEPVLSRVASDFSKVRSEVEKVQTVLPFDPNASMKSAKSVQPAKKDGRRKSSS